MVLLKLRFSLLRRGSKLLQDEEDGDIFFQCLAAIIFLRPIISVLENVLGIRFLGCNKKERVYRSLKQRTFCFYELTILGQCWDSIEKNLNKLSDHYFWAFTILDSRVLGGWQQRNLDSKKLRGGTKLETKQLATFPKDVGSIFSWCSSKLCGMEFNQMNNYKLWSTRNLQPCKLMSRQANN